MHNRAQVVSWTFPISYSSPICSWHFKKLNLSLISISVCTKCVPEKSQLSFRIDVLGIYGDCYCHTQGKYPPIWFSWGVSRYARGIRRVPSNSRDISCELRSVVRKLITFSVSFKIFSKFSLWLHSCHPVRLLSIAKEFTHEPRRCWSQNTIANTSRVREFGYWDCSSSQTYIIINHILIEEVSSFCPHLPIFHRV